MCERYDHRQMSLFSAEVSPVRTSAQQERALASQGHVQGFGMSSDESPKRSGRRSSSSKTSPAVPGVGCPTCGETCTCWGTEPVPSRYLPATSERRTCDDACSSLGLYPTPTATSYGTNKGGAAGRVGKERPSLETLAREWPTPTASEGNGAGEGGREGGLNLRTAVMSGRLSGETATGGRCTTALSPWFVEALMGFPDGWTYYHPVKHERARPRRGGRA
jgi:hypothetical protein